MTSLTDAEIERRKQVAAVLDEMAMYHFSGVPTSGLYKGEWQDYTSFCRTAAEMIRASVQASPIPEPPVSDAMRHEVLEILGRWDRDDSYNIWRLVSDIRRALATPELGEDK